MYVYGCRNVRGSACVSHERTHGYNPTNQMYRSLGCSDEGSCRALTRSHDQDQGEEPPHLILLVRREKGGCVITDRSIDRCHDGPSIRSPLRVYTDPRKHQGGGMGAGKTTLKKMVMASEFYRRYGHGVVAVEADHMKVGR